MWRIFALIFLIVGLGGCSTAQHRSSSSSDVKVALSRRYPDSNSFRDGEFQFDKHTPIEAVELPALAKALPDVRFFITKLQTGQYEYSELEIAVAASSNGAIAVFYSPLYRESDPELAEVLSKARVASAANELGVADDIAQIFAMITYKGTIRAQHLDAGNFSAELWHDDMCWRHISITFANGRVASVSLTNPSIASTQSSG